MLAFCLATIVLAQPIISTKRVVSPMGGDAPAPGNQVFPLAVESGGQFHVAWIDYRIAASFPAVFSSVVDPVSGAPLGPNRLVSPRGGTLSSLASTGNGRVAVAWDDDESSFVRLMDGAGAGPAIINVPGLAPSVISFDGGVFLAVANPSALEGRRVRLDGSFDATAIPLNMSSVYASLSTGVANGNQLLLASQLTSSIAFSAIALDSLAVSSLPSVQVASVSRLRAAPLAGGLVLMTQVSSGSSRLDTWNGSAWGTPSFIAGSTIPADVTTTADGSVITALYDAPFGPRITAGMPPNPPTTVPTSGSDVALARAGSRLLFATSTSGRDLDLFGLVTTLDWTDGGVSSLIGRTNGSMDAPSVAFDGTRWLLVWSEPRPSDLSVIAGAFIDDQGVPSAAFEISGAGNLPSVAYAAGRFVVGYVWNEAHAVSVSSTGQLGPNVVFTGPTSHGVSALTVDDTVWVLYPTELGTLELGRYHADGGSSQGARIATGSSLRGVQLVRRASGGVQAVWLDGTTDRVQTSLIDAQGTPGSPVTIASNVSGAIPVALAHGDDVIVSTFLGGLGLRVMRLSGTTIAAQRHVVLGHSFSSTLGLSIASSPMGPLLGLTIEGDNTVQVMPLDMSGTSIDAGVSFPIDSEAIPLAGTAMSPGGSNLLVAHRQFDPPSASMRLWVRLLLFSGDGGVIDGGVVRDAGVDAGLSLDAGVADAGAADAGVADAGVADAGTESDSGVASGDGGALEGTDAGVDGGSAHRFLNVACGCGSIEGPALLLVVLGVGRWRIRRSRRPVNPEERLARSS